MAANIFFLIIVIFMVCLVLMQVRNQNMKEKYAALWLSVGGVMIVLALFPKLLDWFSSLVGIETPVNLLFLIAIVMLMGISLHLTLAISKLTDDARTIAEEVAIMRALQRQPEGAAGRGTARPPKRTPPNPPTNFPPHTHTWEPL